MPELKNKNFKFHLKPILSKFVSATEILTQYY